MPATLLDTNILVYSYDLRDRRKQSRAVELLNALILGEQAVVSVQCLAEFFAIVTRRLPEPLAPRDALERAEHFARVCHVLELGPAITLEGLRASVRYGLSPWDGLIWAAAKLNQVPYILTEDAEHGRVLEGVRYLNPFDPSFDARALA